MAGSCAAGIPLYFYPWPASRWWQQVAEMPSGTVVIVNPASGPGEAVDPRYETVVEAAHSNGLVVLGYTDSDYGAVAVDSIVDESARHRSWYAVDGIFVDRTAPDDSSLPHYTELAQRLHDVGLSVAINPGQPFVDPGYADVADHVVVFEGPQSAFVVCKFPRWTQEVASDRIWHLVYGVATADAMQDVVTRAAANNAGLVYVTDGMFPIPWDHLPPYWELEQQLLARTRSRR